MDFEKPDWLTKEYLKNSMENGKNYSVEIQNLEFDMPIAKGNNYLCDIFRADIQYRKSTDSQNLRSISLIIKAPKKGPMFGDILKLGVLQKETRMYYEFSPKLKSIFNKNSHDDEDSKEHVLPKSYASPEEYVLILEDLKRKGYKMADRLKQLDYNHCVVALKSLAKFHAGSVLLYEKEPEFVKEVGKETLFKEDPENMCKKFTNSAFKLFIEAIKKHPELEKYVNSLEQNLENDFDLITNSIKLKETDFNVMNHGDFWVTNMLFKYNDDDMPIKVKLIDLQISRYTSPVIDFMYFVDGSVQEEVRKERMDDLKNLYLNELNSILERCGSSKRLEKCEFEKSLKERSYFRIYVLMSILAFCVVDPKLTFDIQEISEDQFNSVEHSPMKQYFSNEKYIKIASKRLEEFEQLGLITAKL